MVSPVSTRSAGPISSPAGAAQQGNSAEQCRIVLAKEHKMLLERQDYVDVTGRLRAHHLISDGQYVMAPKGGAAQHAVLNAVFKLRDAGYDFNSPCLGLSDTVREAMQELAEVGAISTEKLHTFRGLTATKQNSTPASAGRKSLGVRSHPSTNSLTNSRIGDPDARAEQQQHNAAAAGAGDVVNHVGSNVRDIWRTVRQHRFYPQGVKAWFYVGAMGCFLWNGVARLPEVAASMADPKKNHNYAASTVPTAFILAAAAGNGYIEFNERKIRENRQQGVNAARAREVGVPQGDPPPVADNV